jgi:hypothetical protein
MRMLTSTQALCAGLVLVLSAGLSGQAKEAPIPHASGQSVTPSFEGWYQNPDGSFSLSFGYFNRNYEEVLDIPVGPNNRIEPGPADQGQPTRFQTRRHTGVFTIRVPKDFGERQKVTWTLVSGGQTIAVPGHLRPEWKIDALREPTSQNTPPVVTLAEGGPSGQGPGGVRLALTATKGTPLPINIWVKDDNIFKATGGGEEKPVMGLVLSTYRGPGKVAFSSVEPKIDSGKASATATFSEAGNYVLRVLAWDASGRPAFIMAGGFQCCWTNAYVDVTVK